MKEEIKVPISDGFKPNSVLEKLFAGEINPSLAARALMGGFLQDGMSPGEIYERIKEQHLVFHDSNMLSLRQAVNWDHVTICLETMLDIPNEARVSRNRLVPPGSPVGDIPFEDMPF